jgi:hypothetical protein
VHVAGSLEWALLHRFLSGVLTTRIRAGVRAGLIAAAATAGALVGFGIRHDDAMRPFAALGATVLTGFGATTPPRLVAIVAGFLAHVSWMVFWGIAFAAIAHRRTRATIVLVALLTGLVATLAAGYFVPAALGAVKFAALQGIQAVLCIVLMTAGLVMGRELSRAD